MTELQVAFKGFTATQRSSDDSWDSCVNSPGFGGGGGEDHAETIKCKFNITKYVDKH